jgi:hypothetical protein
MLGVADSPSAASWLTRAAQPDDRGPQGQWLKLQVRSSSGAPWLNREFASLDNGLDGGVGFLEYGKVEADFFESCRIRPFSKSYLFNKLSFY